MKEKIEQFIKDNNLDLSVTGSALNSVCTILSGYALYLKLELVDFSNIIEEINSSFNFAELERVFLYAEANHYEKFWMTAKAKKMYKF
jgi:hypothetical protein